MKFHLTKIVALLVVVVLSYTTSFSQPGHSSFRVDSLKSQLRSSKGTDAVDLLNLLSSEYTIIKADSSLMFARMALKNARALGYRKGEAYALFHAGQALRSLHDNIRGVKMYDSAMATLPDDKIFKAKCLIGKGIALQRLDKSRDSQRHLFAALLLFRSKGDKNGECNALNFIGGSYYNLGDYGKALEYFLGAKDRLDRYKIVNNLTGNVTNNIGEVYIRLGDYPRALSYCLEALKIFDRIDAKKGLTNATYNVGDIYSKQNHHVDALSYYQKALDISLKSAEEERERVADTRLLMGETYRKIKKYEDAKLNLIEALDIYRSISNKVGVTRSLNELGKLLTDRENYDHAMDYFSESLRLSREINNKSLISNSLLSMGNLEYKLGHFRDALVLLLEGMEVAQATSEKEVIKGTASLLSEIYGARNDHKRALKYYKIFAAVRDSLFNDEKKREIVRIAVAHEIEKRDNENDYLKKTNTIKEAVISKQNFQKSVMVSSIALLLVSVAVVYVAFVLKNKSNKKLSLQNEIIRQQADEITLKNKDLEKTLTDLQNAQARLIHAEKMASLGMLTAGIAHEINNPINFIFGGLQALEQNCREVRACFEAGKPVQEELFTESQDLFDTIRNGVTRTAGIIQGLNSFSRSDQKISNSINLHDCLDSTLTILNSKLKDRVHVNKVYHKIPLIRCNPGQINQVFLNIINNAIQAIEDTNSPGEISITTFLEGEYVAVSFKDNGPGIPDALLTKVFDPFFSTKEIGRGTGLGLSICYNIIREHHGFLDLKSKVGIGTELIVKLPSQN
ncbi:MAG: tetratricopeptide repeat-containing sensor histidine kinase [Bacteroidota bacterium]